MTLAAKVRWEEMFPDELRAAIAARPVCYLSYGLCEPHGPQNALGLDGLKAYGVVEAAARAHGGVVAPPIWWHISEVPVSQAFWERAVGPQWRSVGGTFLTSIPPRLFYEQLVYHLRGAELAGCRAAVLVTGHYGGIEVDMRRVTAAYCARRPLRAAAVSDGELIRCGDYHGDHAGRGETSQLWAVRPDLVDLSRFPAGEEGAVFGSGRHALAAHRRWGEEVLASQIESLRRLSDRLLAEAAGGPPTTWFPAEEADAIWQEVRTHEADWQANQPVDTYGEHLARMMAQYPTPEW